jgi:hypothetical protein
VEAVRENSQHLQQFCPGGIAHITNSGILRLEEVRAHCANSGWVFQERVSRLGEGCEMKAANRRG